jgi:hypothetical protein
MRSQTRRSSQSNQAGYRCPFAAPRPQLCDEIPAILDTCPSHICDAAPLAKRVTSAQYLTESKKWQNQPALSP